jgi:hypothetical protein
MISTISKYLASGQAGLWITSAEPDDVYVELLSHAVENREVDGVNGITLLCWDAVDGLIDIQGQTVKLSEDEFGQQKATLYAAMDFAINAARVRINLEQENQLTSENEKKLVIFIKNFDRWLFPNGQSSGQVDSFLLSQVQKLIGEGQNARVYLLAQSAPDVELPPELVEHFEVLAHNLPDNDERQSLLSDLDTETSVTPSAISATAGLSRTKLKQYGAEALAEKGAFDPQFLFGKKAKHLARSSKLDVWSPDFQTNIKLWADPAKVEEFRDAIDMTLIAEEHVSHEEIRAKISYVQDDKKVEKWLDPMLRTEFDKLYRPERNFYTFDSVIGLNGLKSFLTNGFRDNVPSRSKLKHVLMLGVPGTGKSMTMKCCAGQFNLPLSTMQAANLYSKWVGETDKLLAGMLRTVEEIGGILAIDEFQRFLPSGSSGEAGGLENRMLGTLLTWFNDQNSCVILSAANNIANLPDEVTRSGRVDALFFVGFPSSEAKNHAWEMYMERHNLPNQSLPKDDYWTPADISACCRLAEMQRVNLVEASKWITPSYEKNKEQMDNLLKWAESAGCICAETGQRFKHDKRQGVTALATEAKRVTRKVKKADESAA